MTPPEVAFLVENSGAKVVITETVLAPVAAAVRQQAPALETVIVAGSESENGDLGSEDDIAEPRQPNAEVDLCGDTADPLT